MAGSAGGVAITDIRHRTIIHSASTRPDCGVRKAGATASGWQPAEYAGHNNPYGLQTLLSRSTWDSGELQDDVQEYVAQRLGAPDSVLIVDDTGFLSDQMVALRPSWDRWTV